MSGTEIGVIGLGVMGANLVRNIVDKGHRVAVHDTDPARIAALAGTTGVVACADLRALLDAIAPPRPVLMMVPAGDPVEAVIGALTPLMAPGDILIDAGNSDFHDTRRRTAALERKGLAFLGMGVSGGAEGALKGPAIMAGGSIGTWERLAPVLTSIAAHHDGQPSAGWLGPDGAGHFVKTVHNGIEYADMQMIAEIYGLLRDRHGLDPSEIADIFEAWNSGPLASYLISISAAVARTGDPETGQPMLDVIADIAGQKGTGRWSVIEAQHLGSTVTTFQAAVDARNLSAQRGLRAAMQGTALPVNALPANALPANARNASPQIKRLEGALLAGRIIAYSQGFALLGDASASYGWDLRLDQIARIWRAGCIIRSVMLDDMAQALEAAPQGPLMAAPLFAGHLGGTVGDLRAVCAEAITAGVPAPALTSALQYHDQLARPRGTANMLQALRDCFGQHGFQRTDRDGTGHHANWDQP